MPTVSTHGAEDHARNAFDEAGRAVDAGERTFEDAHGNFSDMAREALEEGLSRLRSRSRDAYDVAGDQFDHARGYVVDQVHERPLATVLAALGAGFLAGLLFAGGRR